MVLKPSRQHNLIHPASKGTDHQVDRHRRCDRDRRRRADLHGETEQCQQHQHVLRLPAARWHRHVRRLRCGQLQQRCDLRRQHRQDHRADWRDQLHRQRTYYQRQHRGSRRNRQADHRWQRGDRHHRR
ncbi:Uncharacterised protein [Vibrio cholerae]|nr:Uncharacterised protein [Vibrio cholerae]